MGGHRCFDLQHYDNGTCYMADELNAYILHDTTVAGYNFNYMVGAKFIKGKKWNIPYSSASDWSGCSK